MAQGIVSNSSIQKQTAAGRLLITSYDSGYEHSLDRFVDMKLLLQEQNVEANDSPATLASAA
ncbi:MAG TPA: hypothetical protein VN911_15020 [Candidatus Acidoferrum sp.]|jgi:hypothetical protein|nr:hypothetical protein [Candidatus Acidoferrum sp.]